MFAFVRSLLVVVVIAAPCAATPLTLPDLVDGRGALERELERGIRESIEAELFAHALWLVEMRIGTRPSMSLLDLRRGLRDAVRDRSPLEIVREGDSSTHPDCASIWRVKVGEPRWEAEISLVEKVDLADYRPTDDTTALHPSQIAAERRVDDLLADIERLLEQWQSANELTREHLRFRMDLLERELARAAEHATGSALDERVVRWERVEVHRSAARVRAILAAPIAVVRDDGIVVARRSVKISREFDIPWNRQRDTTSTDPRTLVGPVRNAIEEEFGRRVAGERTKLVDESLELEIAAIVDGPTTPARVDRAMRFLAHGLAREIHTRELLVDFVERADRRTIARRALSAIMSRD